MYAENSAATVAVAAACLDVPLDAVFTLHLPDGDTQQLSPPFQGALPCGGLASLVARIERLC